MRKEFKIGDRIYDTFRMKPATIIDTKEKYQIKYDDGQINQSVNGVNYVLIDPSSWTLVTVVYKDEPIKEGASSDTNVPNRSSGFNPKLTSKEAKALVAHLNTKDDRHNQTW